MVAVSLGLILAAYDARLFAGDYQGLVPGARWARGRLSASLGAPVYRLQKNGKVIHGIGDVMAHGHVMLVTAGALAAGGMVMASAPTGDDDAGLGMGHVMLMPELWGAWSPGRLALSVTAGYARALGAGADAHAEHGGGGVWPLVEPMNAAEVTFGATGMVALAQALAAGARVGGAVPTGDGVTRVVGAVRVAWRAGGVETAVEVQGGVAGDPFSLRGVVETSVRLD